MKILLGTDNFYPNVNGAARFAYELAKGLVIRGYDISVIAPARKFKYTTTRHEGITIYGIPSVMIPKIIHPAKIRIPLTIDPFVIERIVAKVDPEIIHIQDHFMICTSLVNAAKKFGIPKIGTNHFLPDNLIHYLHTPAFAKKPLSEFAWRQFIDVYKQLDLVTTPTKTAANLIKNLGLKNLIIPVSCGVDLNKFNPKNNGSYLKKRYKVANLKPVVLFVGRLDHEKNIDVIIKAFAKVLNHIEAELVIAGKGKEKSNLVNLANELGIGKNITFTGLIPDKDLPFLYRIADVFVIASTAELQSIATMEAMASGLPVVAARAIALPELVYDNKNGYLFDRGDAETLANRILTIIRNPALKKAMSENSLKIISGHDIRKTVKSYEEIYQKLLRT